MISIAVSCFVGCLSAIRREQSNRLVCLGAAPAPLSIVLINLKRHVLRRR